MKKRWFITGRESGQSLIEYVLVLLVVIIITLSLIYQFHSAFRNYAKAFFGGYIACLLETGELPGTGAQLCREEMPNFDLKKGKKQL